MSLGSTNKDSENNKKSRKQESHELDYKEHSNVKSSQEMKVNDPTLPKQPVQPQGAGAVNEPPQDMKINDLTPPKQPAQP